MAPTARSGANHVGNGLRRASRSRLYAAPVVMACSRFNAAELEAMGYGGVGVLPLMLDFNRLSLAPDRRMLRRLGDGAACACPAQATAG